MAIFICIYKLPVVAIHLSRLLESFFLNLSSLSTDVHVLLYIRFVQETFVHVTYVPFQLPSVTQQKGIA